MEKQHNSLWHDCRYITLAGSYRRGFEGKTRFAMADFGIVKDLGPKSKDVEMILSVEGIRQ